MNYSIGDICFAVEDSLATRQPAHVQSFLSSNPPQVHCTQTLEEARLGRCLFHSGVTWHLCQMETDLALCMHRGVNEEVYQILRLNGDFSAGCLYAPPQTLGETASEFSIDGALFQIWANFLLVRSKGIVLHGLGVKIDGGTHLFVGKSGAGKSTLGYWFHKADVGEILSDDRIIIRMDSSLPTAYGTPWNGNAAFHRADAAPLAAIYFLEQSTSCMLSPMSAADSTARLFAHSFVAGWPADEAVNFVLDSTARLVTAIPCYRFAFTPDEQPLQMMGWV